MRSSELARLVDEGCARAESGAHTEAIELFTEAICQGEDWVGLNLGNSLLALGDVNRAIDAYASAWRGGCDDAGFNLAHQLESQGGVDQARDIYRRLIRRGYSKAMVNEAGFLHDERKCTESCALLKRALEDEGPVGDLAAGLLGVWECSGNGSAESLLRRGVNAYPSARADLGMLLIATDRLDEGIAVLQVGAERNETESLLPLANWHSEHGEPDLAADMYRRGFALGDAHAAFNHGAMLWADDHRKSARKWIRRAADAGDTRAEEWLTDDTKTV